MGSGAELGDWVRLTQVTGLGTMGCQRLLQAFGLPGNIFATDLATLATVVTPTVAQAVLDPPTFELRELMARTNDWAYMPGNRVMTLADPDYPPSLLEIPDPPVLLYLKGRVELLSRPALAIVGSRNASVQGAANARRFAQSLSHAGVTIVSGLALGIDTAAHQGSLEAGPDSGATIAVIGTGIDIVYPARNHALAHQIADHGCLVSEYALGTAGIASNFPRRNRLISGLSLGVLVVEAAARSGSLITARLALEQGRDVFAIPGSIHSALSKGCHQLIRQGAKLVESAEHILEELPALATGRSPATAGETAMENANPAGTDLPASGFPLAELSVTVAPTGEENALLELIGHEPFEPGQLCCQAGLDYAGTMAKLLRLELAGLVTRLSGGCYQRLA